jgi:hypothetical protein
MMRYIYQSLMMVTLPFAICQFPADEDDVIDVVFIPDHCIDQVIDSLMFFRNELRSNHGEVNTERGTVQ